MNQVASLNVLGEFPFTDKKKTRHIFLRILSSFPLAATKLLKFIAKLFKFTLNCSRKTYSDIITIAEQQQPESVEQRDREHRGTAKKNETRQMQHLINSLVSVDMKRWRTSC